MLMCSQLIIICVERRDVRLWKDNSQHGINGRGKFLWYLKALAGTDGLDHLLNLAALVER